MPTPNPAQDPRTQEAQPEYDETAQEAPGSSAETTVTPNYGEDIYVGSGKLKDRAAIITGADSGIGRAVALAFAREGADVLISYLSEDEDAKETARLVESAGRKAVLMPGDISQEAHCQKIIQTALDEFGKLDILVNNAAFQMPRETIMEVPSDEWDKTFRTNVYSMFYLCKAALPKMPQGGSIVNSCSIEAFQPDYNLLAYAASKGAIVNFTKGLSGSAIKLGIRVNSVAPGPIWTPLIPSTLPLEMARTFGQDTPIGRAGQPYELAPVYVLLASQEASYITGQTYGVTGGDPLI